ncbi:hypothetical protein H5410_028016 [Solanum commersonii]|uniref:Uncharacterized protein n=1 Tax=Solanum commersonii TaxID=4109 RepID=A0A9J5Z512_SOLCO|nr:hypothetical protein H5410_028016 [Solanum commersonii]
MFCFCSSAVISSGPLAFSKIQVYSDVNLYSYTDHLEEILVHLMRENRKQLTRDIFSARSVRVCGRKEFTTKDYSNVVKP